MRSLLKWLIVVGGAGNVVVPLLNGIIVVALEGEPTEPAGDAGSDGDVQHLTASCTVGVFVERLKLDASPGHEIVYRFTVDGHRKPRPVTRAELVALAG